MVQQLPDAEVMFRTWALAQSEIKIGEVYNLSSSIQISIADLVEKIIEQIGGNIKVVSNNQRYRPKNSEVLSLIGSSKKLKKHTKWEKKYSLTQGLEATIEYMDNNISKYKTDRYIV